MPINSRNKGARGEREWAAYLRAKGIPARRGQQFAGGTDSPDVISAQVGLHYEVKRVERFNAYSALEQAIRDAGEKTPVVAHRRSRKPWVVVMLAEDFLRMHSAKATCSTCCKPSTEQSA